MSDERTEADALLNVMTSVTDAIGALSRSLGAMPNFNSTNSGCDVRRYSGGIMEHPPEDHFDTYLEVESKNAQSFVLTITLIRTASDWIVRRSVERILQYGGDDLSDFPELCFQTIGECERNKNVFLDEFVRMAPSDKFSRVV